MSREERRAYQRQMRNVEKGPSLPPAAKARAERNAARRPRRAGGSASASAGSRRYWVRSLIAAVVLGFLAFSLQWGSGMPTALYVALAVVAVVLVLAAVVRFLQRRAAVAGLVPPDGPRR